MAVYQIKLRKFTITVECATEKAGYIHIQLRASLPITFDSIVFALQRPLPDDLPLQLNEGQRQFICPDVQYLSPIYEALKTLDFLQVSEQTAIIDLINKKVNPILEQRNKRIIGTKKGHETVLESTFAVYVDDILDNTNDIGTVIKLLRATFLNTFLQKTEEIKKFLHDNSIDASVYESMDALWKICSGKANMESTLMRMGGLPASYSQRSFIFKYYAEQLSKKYQPDNDIQQFFQLSSLARFLSESASHLVSPFCDDTFMDTGQRLFLPKDVPFSKVFYPALEAMGIIKKGGGYDIPRLEALNNAFKQKNRNRGLSVLSSFIAQLKEEQSKKQNPLLVALKEQCGEAVKALLTAAQERPDKAAYVNQFFFDKATPLITAVNTGNPALVQLVLDFKPNIHSFHRSNSTGSALGAAIEMGNCDIVRLLITARASRLMPCYVIYENTTVYMPGLQRGRPATPLECAFYLHEKNSSDKTLAVVELLLEYGCALGQFVDIKYSDMLEGRVLIGGGYKSSDRRNLSHMRKPNVIDTLDAFIAQVPSERFPDLIELFEEACALYELKVQQGMQAPARQRDATLHKSNIITEYVVNVLKYHIHAILYPTQEPHPIQTVEPSLRLRGNDHIAVLAYATYLRNIVGPQETRGLIAAIKRADYHEAIRIVCVSDIKSMTQKFLGFLAHHTVLITNINQQSGSEKKTLSHHAAEAGNQFAYNWLVENGANSELRDASERTADECMQEHLSSRGLAL